MTSKTALSLIAAAAAGLAAGAAQAQEEPVLNVYNWSDYIAEDTIEKFEAETGIKVTYDVYDSNEVLETKLMAGSTGYDVVVPATSSPARSRPASTSRWTSPSSRTSRTWTPT